MYSPAISQTTLADNLWKNQSLIRHIFLALAGSAILTLSAKFTVPMLPVPLSMQTFAVLVIGMVYGWKLGGATVLLYLLEGAVNLPVFAGTPEKGIGIAYMTGPTGGYLFGFLIAAMVCGWLAERGWDRKVMTTLLAMLIGNAIIYLFGIGWLGTVLGWDKPILSYGLYPFLIGDGIKIALAMCALPFAWKWVNSKK